MTVAEPSLPTQVSSVVDVVVEIALAGSVTAALVEAVQPLASLTVTVYVLATKLLIVAVLPALDQR